MLNKTKTDIFLEWCEKHLTRLNVYGALAAGTLLLILFGSAIPDPVGNFLAVLIENQYWPFALLLFEIFLREVEKKTSKSDRSKLASLEAVITSGQELEPGYLLAIINGRDGELSSSMTDGYIEARMRRDNPINQQP